MMEDDVDHDKTASGSSRGLAIEVVFGIERARHASRRHFLSNLEKQRKNHD